MDPQRPRQLFRHGGIYALTSLATATMSLAVLPIYARYLGPEGMGLVELFTTSAEWLALLVGQGITGAWFRLRFDHEGEARRRFESTVVWYLVGSSIAVLLVLHWLGPMLAQHLTPSVAYYPLWFLTFLGACATVFGDLYAIRLQADQRSTAYAWFMIGRRAVVLVAIALWIVAWDGGAAGKVKGEALALGAAAVVAWWLIRPKLPSWSSRGMLSGIVVYGVFLLPHALALQILGGADRFILSHHLGLAAVGVYAMGSRIARVMETINIGLSVAYRAVFTERVKKFEAVANTASPPQGELDGLASLGLVLVATSGLVCQLLSALAYDLLLVVVPSGGALVEAWRVVPVICIGLMPHACYLVLVQPLAYFPSKVNRLPAISGAGAAVNLLCCFMLIPAVGIMGAAWAKLIGYLVMALGAYYVGRNVLPVVHRWRPWWLLFALTTVALASYYWIDSTVSSRPLRISVKLVVLVAATFSTLRILNVSTRSIRNLLGWTGEAAR